MEHWDTIDEELGHDMEASVTWIKQETEYTVDWNIRKE
jgi:hypothetical protein